MKAQKPGAFHTTIAIVSDSTGQTAEQLVRAALLQFSHCRVAVKVFGNVTSSRKVAAAVKKAALHKALIVHTLVSAGLRHCLLIEARKHGTDALDLMGPLLRRLTARLKTAPREKPGLLHQLTEERVREIEAVEYAFHHDDGRNTLDLGRAEIIITGVSRTMKTPTTLYLAYRGWFAANVPLILNRHPPQELINAPARRVFCLDIDPGRLVQLRRVRASVSGISPPGYTSVDHASRELRYARELTRRYRWQIIEVSNKSVEDIAQTIITLYRESSPENSLRE